MPSDKHPFSAIPAARSSAPILKIKVYVVLGALALAALLGPLAFLLAASKSGAQGATTATVDYSAAGYARLVAEDYLSGRPTAVPVASEVDPTFNDGRNEKGTGLEWTGLTLVASEVAFDADSQQDYEISKFVFLLDGKPMKLDVTMLKTDDGPVLAAQPAFRPADLTTDQYNPLVYSASSGYIAGPPENKAVALAVSEWYKAYAAGDSKRLLELNGDPQGRTYMGLGGFTVEGTPEILSYVTDTAESFGEVELPPSDPIYVRVRALLRSDSAQEYLVSTEYDLLVFASNTAQPKVVAWGAAGSAPLTPFSNSNRH